MCVRFYNAIRTNIASNLTAKKLKIRSSNMYISRVCASTKKLPMKKTIRSILAIFWATQLLTLICGGLIACLTSTEFDLNTFDVLGLFENIGPLDWERVAFVLSHTESRIKLYISALFALSICGQVLLLYVALVSSGLFIGWYISKRVYKKYTQTNTSVYSELDDCHVA